MPILTVENLQVQFTTPFGAVKALRGIDFELAKGDILGLVGETGLRQIGDRAQRHAPLGRERASDRRARHFRRC